MTRLLIEPEWQSAEAARGPELRATWARLTIHVGDSCVTRVRDHAARSVRDGVYGPAYPLAEWIVFHWWPLLRECGDPARQHSAVFQHRHNLAHASEGFALPDLLLAPTGPFVQAQWNRRELPSCRVTFLDEGSERMSLANIEEGLRGFIDAVVRRLVEEKVADTPLQQEWAELTSLGSDDKDFCIRAGSMGLDPFDLADETAAEVRRIGSELPESLLADFFAAASPDRLASQAESVQRGVQIVQQPSSRFGSLKAHRGVCRTRGDGASPLEEGYEAAAGLRGSLGLEARGEPVPLRAICGEDIPPLPDGDKFAFDGIVGSSPSGNLGFYFPRKQRAAFRFAFSRGLHEYLTATGSEPALISWTDNDRQKRNRAFAAELLAPAQSLKMHLESSFVSQDEVDELALHFDVSPQVITHQIRNHRLAEIDQAW